MRGYDQRSAPGRKEREGGEQVLPSSSNCVSTPDGPGTEQTSLALRKVVQRLIRLLLPPTSFWIQVSGGGDGKQKKTTFKIQVVLIYNLFPHFQHLIHI